MVWRPAPMLFWHHGHVAHTYLHASSGESRLECVTARQLNLAYSGFPRARETTAWLVMPGHLRRKAIFHKGGSFLSISDLWVSFDYFPEEAEATCLKVSHCQGTVALCKPQGRQQWSAPIADLHAGQHAEFYQGRKRATVDTTW